MKYTRVRPGSQEGLSLPWGRCSTNVTPKVVISLIHLDVYSDVTGCPQPKVPDTKLRIYYQISNVRLRQEEDRNNSQNDRRWGNALYPLDVSLGWGWKGVGISGFATPPYHAPATCPPALTLCPISPPV